MKKLILVIVYLFIAGVALNAQTSKELRSARTTALNLYDRYIIVMNNLRSGGDNIYNFQSLFASNTDSIYNDIIPQPGAPYLSSEDYCQKYSHSIKQAEYSYSDFSMEQPLLKGSKWVVVCHFKRYEKFRSKDDFRYPAWQFDYSMRIEMDRASGDDGLCHNPRITSLKVQQPIKNFVVIFNPSRVPLQWDGFNKIAYDQKCDCWAGDLGDKNIKNLSSSGTSPFGSVSMSKKQPHFYTYQLSKRNIFTLGAYYAPILIGNKLDDQFSDMSKSSNAWRLRGTYGINLMNNASSALFLNVGLDFTNRNHKLSGNYETHYDAVDMDEDAYVRNILAQLNDEHVKVYSLGVPVTISYLMRIAGTDERPHFFSVEAGLLASFKAVTSHSFNMNANYTGTYNYFGQVEFDHYYDYGHFDLNESNVDADVKEQMNKIDAGLTLGLGVWFSLSKDAFLRVDLSMLKGFMSEMKYNGNYRITENNNDYHTPLQSSDKGAFDIYLGLSFIKSL